MGSRRSTSDPPAPTGVLDRLHAAAELALKDRALAATSEGVTISDIRLPDGPIIYANAGFERMTGYTQAEILGRNHRLLQGPATDPATVEKLRSAVNARQPCQVEILNYRKDGTAFWNLLSITPVRDPAGEVTHFIGVQSDISRLKEAELALRHAKHELEVANRRMARDLEVGARIQRSLLPSHLPEVAGAHLAWIFRPSQELAGDTLNVLQLDRRHLGLYVLDVSGHGLPAALLSVTLTHWLSPTPGQSCLFVRQEGGGHRVASPRQVAEHLNRRFPMDPETGQYFTLLYGVLDTRSWEIRFVCAGHPPPAYLPDDGPPRLLAAPGFPVGVVDSPEYAETRVRLAAGDRLCFYTDGATEATDAAGEDFGPERLLASLGESRHLPLAAGLERLVERLEAWCPEGRPQDDVSLVALEVAAEEAPTAPR